jgi:hypothetical protein
VIAYTITKNWIQVKQDTSLFKTKIGYFCSINGLIWDNGGPAGAGIKRGTITAARFGWGTKRGTITAARFGWGAKRGTITAARFGWGARAGHI